VDLLDLVASDVRKPARYVGNEFFPRGWTPPGEHDVRFLLAYPDLYEIGMSNTGLRILYSLLRRTPGTYVDLAFCPWPDMAAHLRKTGATLEARHSGLPLASFDIVGFSLQYELNYTNVLSMLDLGGLPLRSADRSDAHPLVVAGGPCATHPEPMAPFIDAFVMGDGEESVRSLARIASGTGPGPGRRERLLDTLAALPGVYVPARHAVAPDPTTGLLVVDGSVTKQQVSDLDAYLPFSEFPVPAVEAVFDRLSLELARGCTQGCRFCEAGYTYRPPRERSPEAMVAWAEDVLASTGLSELSVASLSTADYSRLVPLFHSIRAMAARHRVKVSMSSLRAYGVGPEVLDILSRSRPSSLTLAPEAGSQRLRDVLNKNVTDQQLLSAVSGIADRGFNRLKLYFMIGIPTETDSDVTAIADLSLRCHEILKHRFGRNGELAVSVSLFVPRPHTPFQWQAMEPRHELQRKIALLKHAFPPRRDTLALKWHNPDMSFLEAVLTRADRSIADVIEAAYRAGATFDSWDECFALPAWNAALAAAGADPARFLSATSPAARLPWDHVLTAVSPQFLAREAERGLAGQTTPPCTPFADNPLCLNCGADCAGKACRPVGGAAPAGRASHHPAGGSAPAGGACHHTGGAAPEREVVRVRVRYRKVGAAILLGHLDLQRHMLLALRRARVELASSQGYRPRPRIYFPPPLPLGQAGLDEVFDAFFLGPVQAEALLESLRNVSTPGIDFTSARNAAEGSGMAEKPTAFEYAVGLRDPESAEAVLALANSGALPWASSVSRCEAPELPEPLSPRHAACAVQVVVKGPNCPRVDRALEQAVEGLAVEWAVRTSVRV